MRCPYCNYELSENAKFCSACGHPLERNVWKTPTSGEEELRRLEDRILFLEEQKSLISQIIKSNISEHKQLDKQLEAVQKEETALRIEISQLKRVQEQRNRNMPYRKEEGERYFLALQREEKTEIKKENRPEKEINGWIIAAIALSAVVIFAYFMGWVDSAWVNFSLWSITRESKNPIVLLAYLAPILYGVYVYQLGTEKYFEKAEGIAWAAFFVNLSVVGFTFLWCASRRSEYGSLVKLSTGPRLAMVAGIVGMTLAKFAPRAEQKLQVPDPEEKNQKILFQVPVLNYPALLPLRPLKVTVDGRRRLSVTFAQYLVKLQLVQADIDLIDRFHNVYCIRNMKISGFEWKAGGYQSESEEQIYNGPEDIVYAKVYIRQHSFDQRKMAEKTIQLYAETDLPVEHLNELRKRLGSAEAFYKAERMENGWRCVCGTENREDEDACICCKKKQARVLN